MEWQDHGVGVVAEGQCPAEPRPPSPVQPQRCLNLQEGANDVVFSVTTQYQGTCRCRATHLPVEVGRQGGHL